MLTHQSKEIGAHTYEVTPLNAIKGRAVFTRFAKMLAPFLGEIAGNGKEEGNERFSRALAAVAGGVSEDDMNFFCDAFAPTTCVVITDDATGRTRKPSLKETFGLHFVSRYDEMVKWLYFCFEVNFGSFFAAAGLQRATSDPAASK